MTSHRAITILAVCLTFAAVAVASAAPQPDTRYAGNTSQGKKASLRTTPTGGGVEQFVIRRVFRCAVEDGEETVSGVFRQSSGVLAVADNGTFRGSSKVRPTRQIKRGVFTLAGRFGPRGRVARGTYRERVRLRSGTRCDTGKVRFRLRAPG